MIFHKDERKKQNYVDGQKNGHDILQQRKKARERDDEKNNRRSIRCEKTDKVR